MDIDDEVYEHRPENAKSQAENAHRISGKISPISSLSADVLLEIFRLNGNMDGDGILYSAESIHQDKHRAMNTIRISSHVCSFWRDLIVNAPILWANLIDFDFLHRAHVQWREVVIHRAQNSLLHVRGSISLDDLDYSHPWWLDFLNSNWPRIWKLDLNVLSALSRYITLTKAETVMYRQGLSSFLSRSTPELQSFRMALRNRCDPLNPGSTLFDNNAPQLRRFEVINMEVASNSKLFSRLHQLRLYEHDKEIFPSLDVLYTTLSRMRQLESLHLDRFRTDPFIAADRLPISLPRLMCIQFQDFVRHSSIFLYWPLLKCIFPGPGCSIRLLIPKFFPSDDLDSSTLSRLARNYFQVNQPTYLSFVTGPNLFTFTDTVTDKSFGYLALTGSTPKAPFFTLFIQVRTDRVETADMRIYRLFKELFTLSFSAAVELNFTINDAHTKCFTDRNFGNFLSSFTSLRKLATTPQTLYHLSTSLIVDISNIFPRLDVLQITVDKLTPLQGILLPFLHLRKQAGVPISTFEYRCTCRSHNLCIVDDLTCLDDITGLKVVWNLEGMGSGEYICGSGTPDVLNFKKQWGQRLSV